MLRADEALTILEAQFGRMATTALVEEWVSAAVGSPDRNDCLGKEALGRAMEQLDVSVRTDPKLLFAGQARVIDGELIINVSQKIHGVRKTFTIAHELGHASLFRLEPSFLQESEKTERLCDSFAAELLMPRVHLIKESVTTPLAGMIPIVAARADAPLTAACIRLTECFDGLTVGIAKSDGTVVRQFGRKLPAFLDVANYLSRIARSDRKSFRTDQISRIWAIDTRFLGSIYLYVVRPSNLEPGYRFGGERKAR